MSNHDVPLQDTELDRVALNIVNGRGHQEMFFNNVFLFKIYASTNFQICH